MVTEDRLDRRPVPELIAKSWFSVALLVMALPFALAEYATLALRHTERASESRLELTVLIDKVKMELVTAEEDRIKRGERPFFLLQGVDLEVNFVAETKASGEVKLVAVTGTSETSLSRSQRVTVHLNPAPGRKIDIPASTPGGIASDAVQLGPTPPSLSEKHR